MKTQQLLSRTLVGAAIGLACSLPALAQTTTVPGTTKSSPAARDAQGHAADSTAPSARAGASKGMASDKASSGTGMRMGEQPRTETTPANTAPGAGLRNSGNSTPPTSGAAGR